MNLWILDFEFVSDFDKSKIPLLERELALAKAWEQAAGAIDRRREALDQIKAGESANLPTTGAEWIGQQADKERWKLRLAAANAELEGLRGTSRPHLSPAEIQERINKTKESKAEAEAKFRITSREVDARNRGLTSDLVTAKTKFGIESESDLVTTRTAEH